MSRTVLVTGANGFVGSHIVDALLERGDTVRAMVRPTSNLRWLEGKPVRFVHASLDDPESLRAAVKGVDAVVHNAGVTSATNRYHYYLHNTQGTRNLIETVARRRKMVDRFVYISSQAAGGPTQGEQPRREEEPGVPVTDYGHSKLLAENSLSLFQERVPITTVRPPAVYGPRDDAFLAFFQIVKRGWMVRFGAGRQVSFVHAEDLARQVLLQLDSEKALGETFHAAPTPPVTLELFGEWIGEALGVELRTVQLPDALLRYGYPLIYPLLALAGRAPFRPDKLPDFLQERWTISGQKAAEKLGMEARYPLAEGLEMTARWYEREGWL